MVGVIALLAAVGLGAKLVLTKPLFIESSHTVTLTNSPARLDEELAVDIARKTVEADGYDLKNGDPIERPQSGAPDQFLKRFSDFSGVVYLTNHGHRSRTIRASLTNSTASGALYR